MPTVRHSGDNSPASSVGGLTRPVTATPTPVGTIRLKPTPVDREFREPAPTAWAGDQQKGRQMKTMEALSGHSTRRLRMGKAQKPKNPKSPERLANEQHWAARMQANPVFQKLKIMEHVAAQVARGERTVAYFCGPPGCRQDAHRRASAQAAQRDMGASQTGHGSGSDRRAPGREDSRGWCRG